eukprot:superscaffoldBa00002686_g14995
MSSVEARPVRLPAGNNPVKMGKPTAAGPRRPALGEITNVTAAAVNNTKKKGAAKESAKPSCAQKVKPTQPVHPVVRVEAPADPLPPVSEESADVSMKEDELCQAFSEALLTVQDVDEQDADMPQLCSEYVKDIYNYLRVLEVQQAAVKNKYSSSKLMKISLIPQLKSAIIQNMAAALLNNP